MKKIRRGNDFVFAWEIERNGLPEDLSSVLEKHLYLSVLGKRVELVEGVDYGITGNVIRIEVTPTIANILGTYKAEFHYILPDIGLIDEDRKCAVDVDAFIIVNSTAQADEPSEFTVTSDMAIAFKGDKGDKGDPLTYDDLTPEQKAELQQPATDAIASIQEVELAVETAEGLRAEAETARNTAEGERQTNTATAILQANTARDLANEKAGLAATATTEANTARDEANLAATAANTKAGEADTAAIAANTAAGLADTARLAIQDDLALKANQTDLEQLESEVSVRLKNHIINSDFVNGLTGWENYVPTATLFAEGDYLRYTNNSNVAAFMQSNKPTVVGDKWYIRATMKVGDGTALMTAGFGKSGVGTKLLPPISVSATDTIIKGIITVDNATIDNIVFGRSTNIGQVIYLKKGVIAINLSDIFGKGAEPNESEFEMLLSLLGDSSFEGEITIPAQKVMQWELALIRKNKNAIIALGGTII